MRNRTILGIVCIFLSLLITFGFSPLINRLLGGDMTVIRLSRDVRPGRGNNGRLYRKRKGEKVHRAKRHYNHRKGIERQICFV